MKKSLIILMIFWMSLKAYNPVIISNKICFGIHEADEILTKVKLYHVQTNIIPEQQKKIIALSNIIFNQKKIIKINKKNKQKKIILFSAIAAVSGFFSGFFLSR